MLILKVTVVIDDEHREVGVAALKFVAESSRTETACIFYRAYEDLEISNTFHIYEEWASVEGFEAHCKTEHYAEFGTIMRSLKAKVNIQKYESSLVA